MCDFSWKSSVPDAVSWWFRAVDIEWETKTWPGQLLGDVQLR
jgi:hypothetical protein